MDYFLVEVGKFVVGVEHQVVEYEELVSVPEELVVEVLAMVAAEAADGPAVRCCEDDISTGYCSWPVVYWRSSCAPSEIVGCCTTVSTGAS